MGFLAGFLIGAVLSRALYKRIYLQASLLIVRKLKNEHEIQMLDAMEQMLPMVPDQQEREEWQRKLAVERVMRESMR